MRNAEGAPGRGEALERGGALGRGGNAFAASSFSTFSLFGFPDSHHLSHPGDWEHRLIQ